MLLRAAAICGLLAPVTVSLGRIGGALAQPTLTALADDFRLSDSGRKTANKDGSTTRLGTTPTGILIILFGPALGVRLVR